MNIPDDPSLPFFTYGLFRPGHIGFNNIRHFVQASEPDWTTEGELLERDGLPLLAPRCNHVEGWLIRFDPASAIPAYTAINAIEPDRLYVWKTAEVRRQKHNEQANTLFGRKPRKGSIHPEYRIWQGEKEPLFTSAHDVIRKNLERYRQFEWEMEPFFQLQMAYMLLWCAIERFVSFKYHLGENVTGKVFKLAGDPLFAEALRQRVKERREVFRSDDPEQKEVLRPDNPRQALKYYYQVRSNITHRGKTAIRDHQMLLASLDELFDISRVVLKSEFSPNQGTSMDG